MPSSDCAALPLLALLSDCVCCREAAEEVRGKGGKGVKKKRSNLSSLIVQVLLSFDKYTNAIITH